MSVYLYFCVVIVLTNFTRIRSIPDGPTWNIMFHPEIHYIMDLKCDAN